MTDELTKVKLVNGVQVSFFDQSNRYFGDFHRLCVQVVIDLPDDFALPTGIDRSQVQLQRTLEKMGVPSAEVDGARSRLIESFMQSSMVYLSKESFPAQMLTKAQQKNRKPATLLFNR